MEKIFKKSLALVLSAALCLTALVGCLTVSAEGTAAKPTYALNAVEGKPGDTVTVTADITNVSEVCAHLIDIVFPTDLTLGKVTDSLGNTYLSYEAWVAAGSNSETPYYNPVAKTDGNHVCLVEFINWPSGDDAISTTSMKFFFECTIPTGATAGTVYTLTPTVQAGKYDDDTKLMDVEVTPGKVTVTTATVCEHDWKFVSAVPATYDSTGETAKGSITFKCSKCEATDTEEVSYLKASTLATPEIGLGSTTELKLRLTTKNYGNSTDGYVQVTHTYLNGAAPSVFSLNINEAELSTNYIWNVAVRTVNFTEEFNTTLYTKRDGVWVSGNARAFSIQSAAMSVVKGSVETYKTVAANLLKMGAEAQKAFDYATDNLADAQLTGSYADYVTTTTPTIEKNDTNYSPVQNAKANKKVGFRTPSIGLSDSTMFNIVAVTTYYEGATDDLKLKLSYTSYNGATVNRTLALAEVSANNYDVSYGMTAPNLRVPVSIQVFNGDTAVSDVAIYSIESLLTLTNEKYSKLANAMINYSDSVKEVF